MKYNNIDVPEFKRLMEEGAKIIDVRSPDELREGSVPGYTQINFFDPSFKLDIDRLDKDITYLIYCRSGNRSGKACSMMGEMGFKNLYNLNGGIGAWNSKK